MKLTRHQADVAVRRLADHYYDATDPNGRLAASQRFGEFRRKLCWQIGADIGEWFLIDILIALDDLARVASTAAREYAEDDLNCAVNRALDNAGIPGKWINRRSKPVSA